jgi:hypothetical protein
VKLLLFIDKIINNIMSNNINSLQLNNDKYDITNSEETTFARFKDKYESGTLVPGRTYIYSHTSMSNLHAYFLGEVVEMPIANNPFSLQIPYLIAVTATSDSTIDENIKVINAGPMFPRCSEWEVKYDLDVTKYDWTDKLNSVTKVTSFEYLKNTYYLTVDEAIETVDNEMCYTFKTKTSEQLTMYGFYDFNANKFYICELEQDAFDGTYYSIVRSSINLVSNCSCGVITYLKDEYGNAMPFDFKTLMTAHKSGGLNTIKYEPWFKWNVDDAYGVRDIINDNVDLSRNGTSTNNIVDDFYDAEKHLYSIPRVYFYGPCHNNTVGKNNDEIRIGHRLEEGDSYGSSNNRIGDKCNTVYISESTAYNVLGNECSGIKVYPMSERNNISGGCRNIIIGTNSSSNTFGDMCRDISMLDGCSYNTIGKGCAEMTMENNIGFNTIGNHCYQLNFINGISHIDVENGTQNYTFGNNDVNYCMINKSTGRQIENNPSVVSQRIVVCKDDFQNPVDGGIYYHTIPLYVTVDDIMEQIIKPMMNAGYIPTENDSFELVSCDVTYETPEGVSMVSSMDANLYQNARFISSRWQTRYIAKSSYPSLLIIGFSKSKFVEHVLNNISSDGKYDTIFEFEIVGNQINTYKNFYERYSIGVVPHADPSFGKPSTQKMLLPIPNIDLFDEMSKSYSIDDFIEILGLKNKGISFKVYSLLEIEHTMYGGSVFGVLDMIEPLDSVYKISPVYSYIDGVENSTNRLLFKDFMSFGYSCYVLEFRCDSQQSHENLHSTGLKLNYPVFGSNGIKNQTVLESKHTSFPMATYHGLELERTSVPSIMLTEDIVTDAVNELRNERTYTPCEISDARMGTHYIGNYEFVDLGLPSGTKWCNCNLGASSEEEVGEHFFFGCDKSVNEMVDEYNATPNPGGSLHEIIAEYVQPRQLKAFIDMGIMNTKGNFVYNSKNAQGTIYDVATKRLGKSFATPSYSEWVELHLNTHRRLFKKNGVFGILFISTINGNTLFIPFNNIKTLNNITSASGIDHNRAQVGVGCSLASTDITYEPRAFEGYPVINSATITTIPTSFGFTGAVQREGPPIIVSSGLQEQRNQLSMETAFPIRPITFI